MTKVKLIEQKDKWMFYVDNQLHNKPFIGMRDYTIIKQTITCNRSVEKRVDILKSRGFDVKRCFVPTYNGIGMPSYLPRKNEIRIIIGRPKYHFCREVYAIIIKPKEKIVL